MNNFVRPRLAICQPLSKQKWYKIFLAVQPVEEIVPDKKFLDYAVRNFDAFKQLKCTVYMYRQSYQSISGVSDLAVLSL
jgi:hypothetical protein